jgi:predicted O-linked N-acetylglucosamine transferase (SPINDLY family)
VGVDGSRLVFRAAGGLGEPSGALSLRRPLLDTFPCTAHTTASDALWAGVPVVTRIGDTFASRVAASILHAQSCPSS